MTDELVADSQAVTTILNGIPDRASSGLVAELRKTLASGKLTLEGALDRIAEIDGRTTRELVAFRLFIRDYMRAVSQNAVSDVGGATNQSHLVRRLDAYRRDKGSPVIYATFNYDSILDQALQGQYGWLPVNDPIDRYVADSRFVLIKLHGSWDWSQLTEIRWDNWAPGRIARDFDVPSIKSQLLSAADRGKVGEDGLYRGSTSSGDNPDYWIEGASISPDPITHLESRPPLLKVPAVAIPLVTKARFACPPRHVQVLDQALRHVDRILTVGWKAGEPLFLDRLKLVPPGCRVLAVNRTETSRRDVTNALSSVLKDPRPMSYSGDIEWAFTDLIAGDRLDDLLS